MLSKSCVVNHVWFLGDFIFGRKTAFLDASENTISHTVSQSAVFEIMLSFQTLWNISRENTIKVWVPWKSAGLAGAWPDRCIPTRLKRANIAKASWSSSPTEDSGICSHITSDNHFCAGISPCSFCYSASTSCCTAKSWLKVDGYRRTWGLCESNQSRLVYMQCCTTAILW